MENLRVTECYFSVETLRESLSIEEKNRRERIRRYSVRNPHRLSSLPILIQLSIHFDEIYSFKTIESLMKFHIEFSLNVFDSFRSTLLMFIVRFQRFRLFEYFLSEFFFHFDLQSKDQQGNTILHYSVIYFPDDLRLFHLLIDKFNENHLDVDSRNSFGFSPLILAMFSGRFDIVLLLLQRTNASPFARDKIFFGNLFDYFQISSKNLKKTFLDRRFVSFSLQIQQSIPSRFGKFPRHQANFFQRVFPKIVDDHNETLCSTLFRLFKNENSSKQRKILYFYLEERFPWISLVDDNDSSNLLTEYQRTKPNSKENIETFLSSYAENVRPKAVPPVIPNIPSLPQKKVPIRLSLIPLLTRPLLNHRSSICHPTNDEK